MISKSRDGVGSNLVANLGGRDFNILKQGCYQSSKEGVAPIRMTYLDNWNMSNSPNSGTNVGHTSSVGQTSAVQELGVGLSGGEGEESGGLE